jgi:hypothetical protein
MPTKSRLGRISRAGCRWRMTALYESAHVLTLDSSLMLYN